MIPFNIGPELLAQTFAAFKKKNEIERQMYYIDMSAFYFRIDYEMERVIKKKFKNKPFSEGTLDNKMFYMHDDVIQKIISRKTAGLLTLNPKITIGEKQNKDLDDFLFKINFWEQIKELYKRSKYFNTVLLMPVYDANTKELRIDLCQGDSYTVIPEEDYTKINQIKFQKVNAQQEIYYSYWSLFEHFITDGAGNRIEMENNPQGKNPFYAEYQRMPISIYRDKVGTDFHGEPNIALYYYQMLHTLKISDNERGEFYYKFPIGIGRNLAIPDGATIDPGFIINNDNKNSDVPVDLQYPNSGTDWANIRENEVSRRDTFMNNQGIPASSASIEVKALSGAAKTIDELELIESKSDDETNLLKFAYDALFCTLMVANKYGVFTKVKPDDITKGNLMLAFQKVKQYESEQDKWLRRENEMKFGMKDVIDFIMEDDGCSEDEARKKLESIRKRRAETQIVDNTAIPKKTTLDIFGNNNDNNQNNING